MKLKYYTEGLNGTNIVLLFDHSEGMVEGYEVYEGPVFDEKDQIIAIELKSLDEMRKLYAHVLMNDYIFGSSDLFREGLY